VLTASQLGHSQSTPAAAQEDQKAQEDRSAQPDPNAQPEDQTDASDFIPYSHVRWTYEDFGDLGPHTSDGKKVVMKVDRIATCDEFATEIGLEDARIQRAIDEGREYHSITPNYDEILGISKKQGQALHDIILAAYKRFGQFNLETAEQNRAAIGAPLKRDPNEDPDVPMGENPVIYRMFVQRQQILAEALGRLTPLLGEKAFNRLDEYIYRTSGERNAHEVSPTGTSGLGQPGDSGETEKVPEVHP
jgi:hypothetical protein